MSNDNNGNNDDDTLNDDINNDTQTSNVNTKNDKQNAKIIAKIGRIIANCEQKETYHTNEAKKFLAKKNELQQLLDNFDNMDINDVQTSIQDIAKVK